MQKLNGYTQNYLYWFASPLTSSGDNVYCTSYSNSYVYSSNNYKFGIRPIVTLKSDIQLTVVN